MKKELVTVDIGKLSKGLNTTFWGVAEIFDAIGAEEKPGLGIVEKTPDGEVNERVAAVSSGGDGTDEVRSGTEESADVDADTVAADTRVAPCNTTADTVETDTESGNEDDTGSSDTADAGNDAPTPIMLTVDDLMKVAARKIKLNRKNSEKIGALVKAYGQSSLKEMPQEKFEAFMTDLSQI